MWARPQSALEPETSLTLLDLNDHTTQLRLSEGTVNLRVRHLDDGDRVEVDTPNLAFNLQVPGIPDRRRQPRRHQIVTRYERTRRSHRRGVSSYAWSPGQSARFSGTDQSNYEIGQLSAFR